jgi:hypothetical protein
VAIRRSGTKFEADVPLDLVAPGDCDWRVWGVDYTVLKDGKPHAAPIPPTPLVWFRAGAPDALGAIRVECGRGEPFLTRSRGLQCDDTGAGEGFLSPGASELEVRFAATSRPVRP